jgi:hypothetical protein
MASFTALQLRVNQTAVRKMATASATWWPGGFAAGPAVPDLGIVFDATAIEALAGIVQGVDPVAVAVEADFAGCKRGDGLVVDGISYVVQKAMADKAGLLVLNLLKGTKL